MPTGFEIASEISLVRSICSRIESIVESTLSMLLEKVKERERKCQVVLQVGDRTFLPLFPSVKSERYSALPCILAIPIRRAQSRYSQTSMNVLQSISSPPHSLHSLQIHVCALNSVHLGLQSHPSSSNTIQFILIGFLLTKRGLGSW